MNNTNSKAQDEIAKAVARTPTADLTASRLDEVVLEATGHDGLAADLFRAADTTATAAAHKAHSKDEGPILSCIGTLTLLIAIAAASGIFARYGQSLGWTWMPPILSPVVAALILVVALASIRGPVGRNAARSATYALVLILIAGGVTVFAPGLKQWELVSIVVSLASGVVWVVWINVVRARNADDSRDIDLAFLEARREARTAMAAERVTAIDELTERFHKADVDLAALESLWRFAASCAEKRGATGLVRADGPVGASKLAAILDIPRDFHDIADEATEAAWEKRRPQ